MLRTHSYAFVTCTFQECHMYCLAIYIYTYIHTYNLQMISFPYSYVRRYKNQKKRTSTVLKGNGEDLSHANLPETEPDLQINPAYVSLEVGQFNDTATYANL